MPFTSLFHEGSVSIAYLQAKKKLCIWEMVQSKRGGKKSKNSKYQVNFTRHIFEFFLTFNCCLWPRFIGLDKSSSNLIFFFVHRIAILTLTMAHWSFSLSNQGYSCCYSCQECWIWRRHSWKLAETLFILKTLHDSEQVNNLLSRLKYNVPKWNACLIHYCWMKSWMQSKSCWASITQENWLK